MVVHSSPLNKNTTPKLPPSPLSLPLSPMEKSETRDFMNVDSFSQLPFIRPAPPKDKPALRLFGIEVPNSAPATDSTLPEDDDNSNNNNNSATEADTLHAKDATTSDVTQSNNAAGSGRKFECHYCCRNFPTSQALGGHQNAHKRERQHAKRAYLQSAAMLHPSSPSDHLPLYGNLLGYHHHHHRMGPTHLPYYPSSSSSSSSWPINTTPTSTNRYYPTSTTTSSYHSYHHHPPPPPPINGSPLAMWRIPSTVSGHRGDRSLLQHQYPPLHPPLTPLLGTNSGSLLISDVDKSKATQSSHGQYLLDQPNKPLQDHVSLDLHL